jgi:hypothetical protein
MATNREMLAEAIADAKTLKEMAIANAKAALEETFTPQLKSMLSLKLQEMSDDVNEEEDLDEAGFGPMTNVKGHGNIEDESSLYEMDDENMNEIDLEELLAEIEEEEIDETLNEAEESEEEETEEEGEPLKIEDMTDEDLKSMIEDVIADMIEAGELKPEHGEEGEEEEGEEEIDMEMDGEEDVDLAELLREIEGEDVSIESLASTLRREFPNSSIKVQSIEGTDDEDMEIVINDDIFISGGAYNEWDAMIDGEEESFQSDAELINYLKSNMLSETTNKLAAELKEAHATINTLRSDLNEVNLLNAKLLYTNKIFKEKTLNESQKVKVLSSFDKATTVKEVKLVYTTLNEGIKVKNTPIRENLGRASKATNTPVVNTKQPIVESNEVFNRMRKLAGLI